jgi:hexokinase
MIYYNKIVPGGNLSFVYPYLKYYITEVDSKTNVQGVVSVNVEDVNSVDTLATTIFSVTEPTLSNPNWTKVGNDLYTVNNFTYAWVLSGRTPKISYKVTTKNISGVSEGFYLVSMLLNGEHNIQFVIKINDLEE